MLQQLVQTPLWDVCIIGGGATGLGIAVDAATRGFNVLLLEKYDFAKGTSSRSTKLVHGGVRYLKQGNVKLVMEALHERGLMMKNAPHLVHDQSFVIPNYAWWEYPLYRVGLKAYDWMAGTLGLEPSSHLSTEETLAAAPTLLEKDLKGGIRYYDGQFDDARMAIHLAMTAADHNATLLNYFPVTRLLKTQDTVCGVLALDSETGMEYEIQSRIVINATGVFADEIMKLDSPDAKTLISPSLGIHIVVDSNFLPGDTAVMIPRTSDGRVLFAVPWHHRIIIGTTDTPYENPSPEPKPADEDVEFILQQMRSYFSNSPERKDIRSVFAGLRPLVKAEAASTAALSREHFISVSESKLITVTGGKWTTYRKMAKDVVDVMISITGLMNVPSVTENLKIHGHAIHNSIPLYLQHYGSDANQIISITKQDPKMNEQIHPSLPNIKAEIKWAVENEMCVHVEDFLARRTRALFLDAKAAEESVEMIANTMSQLLTKEKSWVENEVNTFKILVQNYKA